MTETINKKDNGLSNRFDIPFTEAEKKERRKFYARADIAVF